MKSAYLLSLSALLLSSSGVAFAQTAPAATGTINLEMAEFTSEVKLKPKVEKLLKSGGLEWGAKDGQVVVAMINKRFINFEVNQFTRFGTKSSVVVPAGEYKVTVAALIPKTALSVNKVLEKGAFFNENILGFRVEPGKAVTLAIRPVIQSKTAFVIKIYQPELLTTVVTDAGKSPEVSIAAQNEKSIPWPAYNGPLKFVVGK